MNGWMNWKQPKPGVEIAWKCWGIKTKNNKGNISNRTAAMTLGGDECHTKKKRHTQNLNWLIIMV